MKLVTLDLSDSFCIKNCTYSSQSHKSIKSEYHTHTAGISPTCHSDFSLLKHVNETTWKLYQNSAPYNLL